MIDAIIDHLHDDIESLRTCSLVCKTWTRSARFHLFSKLRVRGLDAKRLLDLASAVIPFVRHLRLDDQPWHETLPLLVGFETIRSLAMTDLPVHCLNAHALSALFRNFSGAVDVRLDDVVFDTAGQLVRFICAFPCLQTLAIHCVDIRSAEFGVDLPILSPSPHLRILELDNVCMDAVLEWFLSLPDRPALRVVGLHSKHTNNPETIAKLLSSLENSLESFLISTAIVDDGMLVIFLSLIHAACYCRIALANRPKPQHMLTLPSYPARRSF